MIPLELAVLFCDPALCQVKCANLIKIKLLFEVYNL